MSKLHRIMCALGLHRWGQWEYDHYHKLYWKSRTCMSCGRLVYQPEFAIFKIIDVCWFFLKKVLPRAVLVSAIFLLDFYFREERWFFLMPLVLSSLLIWHFPPVVETLYIVKKTSISKKDKGVFFDLPKASKDKTSGMYRIGESVVVKSYYRPLVIRYLNEFRSTHDMNEYDVTYHRYHKKGYQDHYFLLLNSGYESGGEEVVPLP